VGGVKAMMKAGPGPEFGFGDEVGAEGVAFDVSGDGEEVGVILNGEGFEAALVERAVADGVVAGAPALGVGEGEPLHEGGELAVAMRAQEQVPVAGHDAVGEDFEWGALVGLEEGGEEGEVVLVAFEDVDASDGAVEDVVDDAARGLSGCSGHGGNVAYG
jgi:hypothetical protein